LRSVGSAPWFAVSAALYGGADDAATARVLLEQWAAHPANRVGHAYLAVVDAILAHRAGSAESPKAERAAATFDEMGFPYYRALALEFAGKTREALEIHRRTGSVRDARRLEAVLEPPNRRGRRPDALTAREEEVARLVALGKSNRAIADELCISERTVENHTASILSKFGLPSRSELIARYAASAAQGAP
jgi:DNA-binding NarL/FixJ family response regulator